MSTSDLLQHCPRCRIDVEPLPYGACPTCYEQIDEPGVETSQPPLAHHAAPIAATPTSAPAPKPGPAETTFAVITLVFCGGALIWLAQSHTLTPPRGAIIGVLVAGAISRLWRALR